MKHQYLPSGTCSRLIEFDITDGIVTDLKISGGCHGNLQGVSALCQGRPAAELVKALKGIKCGTKATSCPDQIASAIEMALAQK